MSFWFGNRPPRELLMKMGAKGLLACMMGPPFPKEYVDPSCLEFVPQQYDYFHELILFDEVFGFTLETNTACDK